MICPDCGKENPDGFAFCGLLYRAHGRRAFWLGARERKVVSSLFCDLVGFTASSEGADPEDVDRMLAVYFGVVRGANRGTPAAWSRSSSATLWSGFSECRPRTRTMRSVLFVRA